MAREPKHPSKEIIGTKGEELQDKTIILCTTGSVAAMHSPELARELMREGAEVHCVMTEAACNIIHPYLMEWATGNPVTTKLTGRIEHVTLVTDGTPKADLVIVAPATANTMSKMAAGIDDTPVTSLLSIALGAGVPIIIAPAAHEGLYKNPIVESNMAKLRSKGVQLVGPRFEQGKAKMADIEGIVAATIARLHRRDMTEMNVMVTAGPTVEHLDPIRILTNRSSGRMGIAMAEEAYYRGANVVLIVGATDLRPRLSISTHPVETGQEMLRAVTHELRAKKYDVFVGAAAVSDFTPLHTGERKISSHGVRRISLVLKPTPKIIRETRKLRKRMFVVGFKAEHAVSDKELILSARKGLRTMHSDVVIANDVGRRGVGFGAENNEVILVDRTARTEKFGPASKAAIAHHCWDKIVPLLRGAA